MKQLKSILITILLVSCALIQENDISYEVTLELSTNLTHEILELDSNQNFYVEQFDPTVLGSQNTTITIDEKEYPITIHVVDTTPPTITQHRDINLKVNTQLIIEDYFTIEDNSSSTIDITVEPFDNSQTGTINTNIIATDDSHNTTTKAITINLVNDTLVLAETTPFVLAVGQSFDVRDYFTANQDAVISIEGSFDIQSVGEYPLTLIAQTDTEKTSLHSSLIVTQAKTGGYEKVQPAKLTDDLFLIVNKMYQLPSDYVPDNLVDVPEDMRHLDQQITQQTLDAFIEMASAASDAGLDLKFRSGYRSYQLQESVYNNYLNTDPQEVVDTYSARAGHSEHQLGTTMDVCQGYNACFNNFTGTPTQQWMVDNAHHYGFILRYPQNKEHITLYSYESWHYRYVGKEVASHFVTTDLTFDQYVVRYRDFLQSHSHSN